MESINKNNNINFTAKMELRKITQNKKRMQDIATLFEQKTKKYPDDTFYMSDDSQGLYIYNISSKGGSETSVTINRKELEHLLKMKNSTIVSKFKKILDIAAHRQKIYDITKEYAEKLYKITHETDIKIWDNAVEIAGKECKDLQNKDFC